MEYPPVTLYIPAYNAGKYLQQTLPSICSLEYPSLHDIYIINDGSDDTDILQELQDNFNIKVINKENNEGLAAARNTALSICKTELIASLDADCKPEKYWLKRLVEKYLEFSSENVAGIGGRLEENFREKLPDLFRARHMIQHHGSQPVFDPEFLAGNNTLYNVNILKKAGNYPENGIYRTNHEDFAISQKVKKLGYHLYYEPSALVYHLRRDTLNSIFKTFWRWYFLFHPEPNSLYNILNKFRRQWIHHALPWIVQDIKAGKWCLTGADILFPFYQFCYDWQYYHRSNKYENSPN